MRQRLKVNPVILLLAAMLPVQVWAQAGDTRAEIAVVVNSKSPVKDISLSKLRRLALGEQRSWDFGANVYLLVPATETAGRTTVLKHVFEMNEAQYKQYWIEKVFRGEVAGEPTRYYANGTVYGGADSFPGTLAFIDSRAIKPGLKVLRVDGKLPGEPGYPLAP